MAPYSVQSLNDKLSKTDADFLILNSGYSRAAEPEKENYFLDFSSAAAAAATALTLLNLTVVS